MKSVNDQCRGAQPSIATALNARGAQAHACGPSQALAQRGNRAIAHLEMSVASGTFTFWGRLKLTEAAPDRHSGVIEARLLNDFSFTAAPETVKVRS